MVNTIRIMIFLPHHCRTHSSPSVADDNDDKAIRSDNLYMFLMTHPTTTDNNLFMVVQHLSQEKQTFYDYNFFSIMGELIDFLAINYFIWCVDSYLQLHVNIKCIEMKCRVLRCSFFHLESINYGCLFFSLFRVFNMTRQLIQWVECIKHYFFRDIINVMFIYIKFNTCLRLKYKILTLVWIKLSPNVLHNLRSVWLDDTITNLPFTMLT